MTDSDVRAHPIPSTSSDGLKPPRDDDAAAGGSGGYTGMDNGETGEDTGYPAPESRGTDGAPASPADATRQEALEAAIGHPLVDDRGTSRNDPDPDGQRSGAR